MTIVVSPAANTATETRVTVFSNLPTPVFSMRELLSFNVDAGPLAVSVGVAVRAAPSGLLVSDLGWSREQAARVRGQLAAFEEGWDSPEMDGYDAL